MTNEEILGVAEILERATNRFNEQAARFRERSAAYDRLIADMSADHERKMAENRAAFGARTEADRQIIEGLRSDLAKERAEHQADADHLNEEIARFRGIADDLCNRLNALGIKAAKQASIVLGMVEGEGLLGAAQRVVKERDALRAEVADLRGIFDMVHASLGIKRGDHIGNAIAALKQQSVTTPKRSHPVKVGEWVKNSDGGLAQVLEVHKDWYLVARGHGWRFANCEPCDPPVDHDTPAGKEAAEAAATESQMTDAHDCGPNCPHCSW